MDFFTRTCTIVTRTPGSEDELGNATVDESTVGGVPCAFYPGGGTEVTVGRDTVLADATLFLPLSYFDGYDDIDVAISALDAVSVDGEENQFEVMGPPKRWTSARGLNKWEVPLRVVTG